MCLRRDLGLHHAPRGVYLYARHNYFHCHLYITMAITIFFV
jgi:hypothetical protein